MNPAESSPESTRPRKTSLLAILGLVLAIAGFLFGLGLTCGAPGFPLFVSLPVIGINLVALIRIHLSRRTADKAVDKASTSPKIAP